MVYCLEQWKTKNKNNDFPSVKSTMLIKKETCIGMQLKNNFSPFTPLLVCADLPPTATLVQDLSKLLLKE